MGREICVKEELKDFGNGAEKLIGDLIVKKIPLKIGINSVHKKWEIFSTINRAAFNSDYIEGTTKILIYLGKKVSSADRIFSRIEQNTADNLVRIFDKIFENSLKIAKRNGRFSRPVYIAIDIHEIPYYGDINKLPVSGGKHKSGTSYFMKYATVCILHKGERFTIAAVPFPLLENKLEIVKNLIKISIKRVKIKIVFLDRGFRSIDIINFLESKNLKYIMPIQKDKKVNRIVNRKKKFPSCFDYEIGKKERKCKVKMIVIKKRVEKKVEKENKEKVKKFIFITNMKVESAVEALEITELYRKRWGIETSYRKKKEFRINTTSTSYNVRVFFFLYSVALYNIWVLSNLLIVLTEKVTFLPEKPKFSSKMFKTILYLSTFDFFRINEIKE